MKYPTEFQEQSRIIKWSELSYGRYPELKLLNSSANGVNVSFPAKNKMRLSGMKDGYPDLSLPVPSGAHHGLYIELKRVKGGTVSPEQKWWLEKLTEQGYRAVICYGADEAIKEIESYLTGNVKRA